MSTTPTPHTPEPWELRKMAGTNLFGARSLASGWFLFENALEKDAIRILACVKACKGLTNEELQTSKFTQLAQDRDKAIQQRDEAKDQCDELKAEIKQLKELCKELTWSVQKFKGMPGQKWDRLRTAAHIAKLYPVTKPVQEDADEYKALMAPYNKAQSIEL